MLTSTHSFRASTRETRRSSRGGIILAATIALSLLVGCSTTSPTTSTSPGSTNEARPECTSAESFAQPLSELVLAKNPSHGYGPCTAKLPERSRTALVAPGTQKLPATVTSHAPAGDEQLKVTDTSRIISFDIAGAIGETIFALGYGDQMVGRDSTMTFAEAAQLPVVTGSSHSINIENVIALNPTLVITDGSIGPLDVVLQLRDAAIPVVFVDRDPSISGSISKAQQVGDALGDSPAGAALASQLRNDIKQVTSQIATIAPKNADDRIRIAFLYLRGSANIYYLFGKGSGADDLIEALNATDVASEIGWEGEKPMTDEALIEANPDLLLVMTKGLDSVGGPQGLTQSLQAVALTNAGKNLNIIDMADSQIMTFGPRTADALDALARAIYSPDAAAQ